MLADPEARKAAFGLTVGGHPVPADLEGVGDPKSLWQERAGQAPPAEGIDPELHADAQRQAAWQELRPDVVAHRCPRASRRSGAMSSRRCPGRGADLGAPQSHTRNRLVFSTSALTKRIVYFSPSGHPSTTDAMAAFSSADLPAAGST